METPLRGTRALDNAIRQRWRRLPLMAQDAVVAGLVLIIMLTASPYDWYELPWWVTVGFQVLSCLPLLWRRRYPFSSALAASTIVFVLGAVLLVNDPFSVFMAAFVAGSAVRHGTPVSLVAPLSGLWILLYLNIATRGEMLQGDTGAQQVTLVVLGVLPALVGYALRLRAERAEQWQREARNRAQQERARERERIARDVHDIAGHHLSAIRLLAVGGRESLRGPDPEADADAVLAAISEASGRAVREVRELLRLLREDRLDEPAPLDVRLDDLPMLVSALEGTGVDVDLIVPYGVSNGVPARVEADAYRIVQESLGNVLRHSSARHVVVRLHRRNGEAGSVRELVVTVEDDASAPAGPPPEAAGTAGTGPRGTGLLGMRERAEGLGGRFEAGHRPGRGWRVRAWLPLSAPLDGESGGWRIPDDDRAPDGGGRGPSGDGGRSDPPAPRGEDSGEDSGTDGERGGVRA